MSGNLDHIKTYATRSVILCLCGFLAVQLCSCDLNLTLDDVLGLPDPSAQLPDSLLGCVTNGGQAGDYGLKTWCWEDIVVPDYNGQGVEISNGQLKIDSECNENQVTNAGDQLRFHLNAIYPVPKDWCNNDFNMRAEVRTMPWAINNPVGTEEWYGWSYTLGDDYIIDQYNQWSFFQVHHGVSGPPQIAIEVISSDQFSGHYAGEIYIVNKSNRSEYHPTGIIPRAGDKLNIVIHVIWGDASNGLLQVWINDQKVYDKQVRTVYSSYPWGGNAKWGIYKWNWRNEEDVLKSIDLGITHLETFMGALRIITRSPDDPNYKSNSYLYVRPR